MLLSKVAGGFKENEKQAPARTAKPSIETLRYVNSKVIEGERSDGNQGL
jgi:hypothetical protein